MCPDDLQALLNQRPFEPLRLHLSNGRTVDIRHPELAIFGRSLVFVATGRGDQPDAAARTGDVVHHVGHYNLLHVVEIEPLNGRSTPSQRKDS